MLRSFSDRVLGGICGGLGALFGRSAWWFRLLFIGLTLLTGGVFAVLYLVLWWMVPQQRLTAQRRSGAWRLLLTLLLAALLLAGWGLSLNGGLRAPNGQELLWPILLAFASGAFLLRQVRT